MKAVVIILALLLFAASTSVAGTPNKLDEVDLSTHLIGPKYEVEDLKGRYVVLVTWSTSDNQSELPYIAYLSGLAEKYTDKQVAIIAAQSHTASNESVKKQWAKHAKNEKIMVVNSAEPSGNTPGLSVHGKFDIVIYNSKGEKFWDDHPRMIDETLSALLDGKRPLSWKQKQFVSEEKVYGRYWPAPKLKITGIQTNHFTREVQQINDAKGARELPMRNLQLAINNPTDSEKSAEAKAIMKQIETWVSTQDYYIKEINREDSVRAYFMATNLDVMLQQDAMTKKSHDLATDLYSGPKTRMQILAQAKLDQALLLADYTGLANDPQLARANPWNRKVINNTLPELLDSIKQDYPDTDAAKRANELRKQWGLDADK